MNPESLENTDATSESSFLAKAINSVNNIIKGSVSKLETAINEANKPVMISAFNYNNEPRRLYWNKSDQSIVLTSGDINNLTELWKLPHTSGNYIQASKTGSRIMILPQSGGKCQVINTENGSIQNEINVDPELKDITFVSMPDDEFIEVYGNDSNGKHRRITYVINNGSIAEDSLVTENL